MDNTRDQLRRIAEGDQAQASTDAWTRALAAYYQALLRSGLPPELAAVLVRDYHTIFLQQALQGPKREP